MMKVACDLMQALRSRRTHSIWWRRTVGWWNCSFYLNCLKCSPSNLKTQTGNQRVARGESVRHDLESRRIRSIFVSSSTLIKRTISIVWDRRRLRLGAHDAAGCRGLQASEQYFSWIFKSNSAHNRHHLQRSSRTGCLKNGVHLKSWLLNALRWRDCCAPSPRLLFKLISGVKVHYVR